MPSPGLIRGLRPAAGPGIRDDGGVTAGYTVPVFYDSMIAKLVAWGGTRGTTPIARMARALREYQVLGIRTTHPVLSLADGAARVRARGGTTRPTSIACWRRAGETFSALATAGRRARRRSRQRSTRTLRAGRGRALAGRRLRAASWQQLARREALRG